jgi:hypothetical protein
MDGILLFKVCEIWGEFLILHVWSDLVPLANVGIELIGVGISHRVSRMDITQYPH